MILVTGSLGLIGFESCKYYLEKGHTVVGVDNDKRRDFLGDQASNLNKLNLLCSYENYDHRLFDINEIELSLFDDVEMIIHCASQPSHDYATSNILQDFHNNATATVKLLQETKTNHPKALFVFLSSNKVYGDISVYGDVALDLIEHETRYDVEETHWSYSGLDETIGIDGSVKSFYGASKASADIYCQEFANYFGLKTYVLRAGCLTGRRHSGVEQLGFLSHLINCWKQDKIYTVFGHKGKQVRDNLHSYDVVKAIDCIFKDPKDPNVYNLGGGRNNSTSILEVIDNHIDIFRRGWKSDELQMEYRKTERKGDFVWWITDNSKFMNDYPDWQVTISLDEIIHDLCTGHLT